MGSPVHEALRSVITNNQLVKVMMERMNENIYTTYLEVSHSVKIRYVPKQIFNEHDNLNRSQVIHSFIVS